MVRVDALVVVGVVGVVSVLTGEDEVKVEGDDDDVCGEGT
jgi:hypothetical protein